MRKGYFLVEMVVVLSIMAMVMVALDRFWVTFIYDLPRDSRLIQENTSLNNVISHIRADAVSAKTLSESVNGPNEPNTLLMKMSDGVISYKFSNGRIFRSFVGGPASTASGDMVWSVPHGQIKWKAWNKDKTGRAVEVSTCIEDENFGHIRKKMANNNLFFAGALWEAAK
ncbi:MAG: type II secretion system protein [Sedimentisphaerales bacterium]|jgi:type II secretory pathway pseudopilin PulG